MGEQEVNIEATHLEPSHSDRVQYERYMEVGMALTNTFDLESSGIILRRLSGPHARELVQRIGECIQYARSHGEPCELVDEGTAEFCFAPKHLRRFVDEWRKHRSMSPDEVLRGPSHQTNVSRRVHRLIQQKCRRQLPVSTPGVLYIEGVGIDVTGKGLRGPLSVDMIEEAVYENEQLLFAVFAHSQIGKGRRILGRVGRCYCSARTRFSLLRENTLLMPNRYCRFKTKATLRDAFWK